MKEILERIIFGEDLGITKLQVTSEDNLLPKERYAKEQERLEKIQEVGKFILIYSNKNPANINKNGRKWVVYNCDLYIKQVPECEIELLELKSKYQN